MVFGSDISKEYLFLGKMFFFDGVANLTDQCSRNPTPSTYDSVCSNFMKVTGYQFKDHANPGKQMGKNGVDEVHLIQILSGVLLYC